MSIISRCPLSGGSTIKREGPVKNGTWVHRCLKYFICFSCKIRWDCVMLNLNFFVDFSLNKYFDILHLCSLRGVKCLASWGHQRFEFTTLHLSKFQCIHMHKCCVHPISVNKIFIIHFQFHFSCYIYSCEHFKQFWWIILTIFMCSIYSKNYWLIAYV